MMPIALKLDPMMKFSIKLVRIRKFFTNQKWSSLTLFLQNPHQSRTRRDVKIITTVLSIARSFPPDFSSRERLRSASIFLPETTIFISTVNTRWRRVVVELRLFKPVHFSRRRWRLGIGSIFFRFSAFEQKNLASGREKTWLETIRSTKR